MVFINSDPYPAPATCKGFLCLAAVLEGKLHQCMCGTLPYQLYCPLQDGKHITTELKTSSYCIRLTYNNRGPSSQYTHFIRALRPRDKG